MKKILLLGGAGYVGTSIAFQLLKNGYEVNILDNFIYGHDFAIKNLNMIDKFKLFLGEIDDLQLLKKASKDVNHVVILAGLVGDPITKKYPVLSKEINENKIIRAIDFFELTKIKKLVFISTCSNYGLIKDDELAHEEFDLTPISLYAKSKVKIENYILSKKNKVKYCGVVLRFATAFGLSERMRFDLTINQFTWELYFNNKITVFDEHTWRPYCHVKDFAILINKVLIANDEKVFFEIFNAGGDENNYTKKMIIDILQKKIDNTSIIYSSNDSDPRNYRVSFKKVKEKLKFQPTYSVEDGIDEIITSFNDKKYLDFSANKDNYGNFTIV